MQRRAMMRRQTLLQLKRYALLQKAIQKKENTKYASQSNGKKRKMISPRPYRRNEKRSKKLPGLATIRDATDEFHHGTGSDDEQPRTRLTTPDIQFDYDRSQLRDPRQTPGRGGRPR